MVKKSAGAFSIYRHVNQRQRVRRHPFDVQDSPSPSPEADQDPSNIFDEHSSSPPQERQKASNTTKDPQTAIKVEDDSLFVPEDNTSSPTLPQSPPMDPPSPSPAAPRLAINKTALAAVTKARQAVATPARQRRAPSESSDEATEAPAAEGVDLGSRAIGISSAALFGKERSPPRSPSKSATPDDAGPVEATAGHEPPEDPENAATVGRPAPEIIGQEHLRLYMQMRRSMRGRRGLESEHTGAKFHIVPADIYFDLCDEDELFGGDDDDAASLPVIRHTGKSVRTPRKDTPHEPQMDDLLGFDPMDFEQPPTPRVRTRSMAPSSTQKPKESPIAAIPESDAEAQTLFVNWTSQLISNNKDLNQQAENLDRRIDDLKAIISIKDEDIEKLEMKVQNLKRKAQATANNEAQITSLSIEVASLREQVTLASTQAEEHKKRCAEQETQISTMNAAQGVEKGKFEQQIQDLQRQINMLKSKPRAPMPPPPPMSPSKPYASPLGKAVGRGPSYGHPTNGAVTPPRAVRPPITPTVDATKYKALYDCAKKVVDSGGMMTSDNFGAFGQALVKLKEEVEKEMKQEG